MKNRITVICITIMISPTSLFSTFNQSDLPSDFRDAVRYEEVLERQNTKSSNINQNVLIKVPAIPSNAKKYSSSELDKHVSANKQYLIQALPLPEIWNIKPLIINYQKQTPPEQLVILDNAKKEKLAQGVAVAFVQNVAEDFNASPKPAAVEISRILINVPYKKFIERLPIESWGSHLAHYLGGEVKVLERNTKGQAIRQVERMVISSLPKDQDVYAFNQDMTKAEQIIYEKNRSIVYWRVFHSDNDSTVMDLGSVEFAAYDANSVLVTFHSAHRLKMTGIPIWPPLATQSLRKTFLDHLRNYKKLFR